MNAKIVALLVSLGALSWGIKWFIGQVLAHYIVGKIHDVFEMIRASFWLRNAQKPRRAKAMIAVLEMLDDEIPHPGTDAPFYEILGVRIASLTPILHGTDRAWAAALRSAGDSLDTEVEMELKELVTPPSP